MKTTGDTGATVVLGDSLTVTFSAPTGLAFVTDGGFMFDYQATSTNSSITESVNYAFYDGSTVVASGSLANQGACCVDMRLPVYSSPNATWDKLVYTATLTGGDAKALIGTFSYDQNGARYVAVVPEASDAAMMLAGLGLFAVVARRRRAA